MKYRIVIDHKLYNFVTSHGKSSKLVQCAITGPRLGKSSESVQCAMLKACDACADKGQL